MTDENAYSVGVAIVGIPTFLGCWGYAIATYGWFLGLGLGWLPAAFIGVIVGLLWPLVLVGVAILVALVLWSLRHT